MPIERLTFTGINRAVSDFSPSGACEELINLRPTTNGLVPAKRFALKASGLSIARLFEHKYAAATNYLALIESNGVTTVKQVTFSGGSATFGDALATFATSAQNVHFASAGDRAVFSSSEVNKTVAFRWVDSQYKVMQADTPVITSALVDELMTLTSADNVTLDLDNTLAAEAQIESWLNKFQEDNPEFCSGPIIVALAYKTTDGKIFQTGQWRYYEPTKNVKDNGQSYKGASDYSSNTNWRAVGPYFDNDSNSTKKAFQLWEAHAASDPTGVLSIEGTKVTLNLSVDANTMNWDEDTSILQSIEIYASKPISYLDYSNAIYRFVGDDATDAYALASERDRADMKIGDQLLYHQASVSLKDLKERGSAEVQLKFGGNIQLTNTTLQVDAGEIQRHGDLLSYNGRFHFYKSNRITVLGSPKLFPANSQGVSGTKVIYRYHDGNKESLKCLGSGPYPLITDDSVILVPSQNVKELILYTPASPSTAQIFRLTPSSRYNYSFHIGVRDKLLEGADADSAYGSVPTSSEVVTDEPTAINVSEQFNPFVFEVEHSYPAPGKIHDLQPQMAGMTDTEYGTYPLNAFTERGIYALMQGSGTTLYGRFRPVSPEVSISNSVPTGMGTFIISSGGLWLVAGEKAVLVSDALHLGPHKYVRQSSNAAWAEIIETLGTINFGGMFSTVDFATYVSGAHLSYNRYQDELYISNSSYTYTYVLSLKYRQWFKLDYKVRQDTIGSDIILVPPSIGTGIAVRDLSNEDKTTSINIFIQSRPFSFQYMYSHIHRLVSLVRADLTGGTKQLIVSLFGSDDLQNWVCLTAAKRNGVRVSQLRTGSAARSWRYYTVCIGGTVDSETDLGPTLVEYQPVIRRIG